MKETIKQWIGKYGMLPGILQISSKNLITKIKTDDEGHIYITAEPRWRIEPQ